MRYVTTAEMWIPARQTFIFRFVVPAKGVAWTFLVGKATLEKLSGCAVDDPTEVFHRFRSEIYSAARERMTWADSTLQQDLSADELLAGGRDRGDSGWGQVSYKPE